MNTKYQMNTQSQHFNNMNRCEYNKHPRHNNNNTNNYKNSNNGGNNNITNNNSNNIHYDTEKYNIVIGRLQNYMFTEENIRRNNSKNVCVKETSSVKKVQLVKSEPRVKKEYVIKEETHVKSEQLVKPISRSERFFVPKQKDSLFWCFYILKNGFLK